MLYKISNQPTKFRAKVWAKINDVLRQEYGTDSQIKFKTSTLRSNFCNYSDAYILFKGTISSEAEAGDVPNNAKNKWYLKIVLHLLIP